MNLDRPREMTEKINDTKGEINGLDAGLITTMIPITIPIPDGGFQFQMGPFGFGWNWTFGLVPPGYVAISPYSPLSYDTPSPDTNVQPFQKQPGALQPLPQYYYPFPVGGSFGRYGVYPFRQASEHN